MQRKNIALILIILVLGFSIKSCSEQLYIRYVLDYDITEITKVCNYPEFATCDQILQNEKYCDSYNFNKKVNQCKGGVNVK